MIALYENDYTCYARWKCSITDGYELYHIKPEKASKPKSKNCILPQHENPDLGTLTNVVNNHQGVYCVDADKKSKNCRNGYSRKSHDTTKFRPI